MSGGLQPAPDLEIALRIYLSCLLPAFVRQLADDMDRLARLGVDGHRE
jgi:hypothetical protein